MALALAGAAVVLSAPAHAEAADVHRQGASQDTGHAAPAVPLQPAGDDEDEVVSTKKSCAKCPPGPPGPPGPRGVSDGIDSAVATPAGLTAPTPLIYVAVAQPNGVVLVRDQTSLGPANPPWHDLSTVTNYPSGVTDVTLAADPHGDVLSVAVRTRTGSVRRSNCALSVNVTWPANCTAFIDITPPL
ncbi:hypothetical protein [Sphaerisporangium krabiense]|uniref:Uncharacterized protein n=1 Tax=Sphaerisporangium krabiense TaxID=763782 RepID=A0A7W8ZAK0_9ACTN|nr:hypothetical protein [Sphaerisporangium krabiense]MBB5630360.1 hypothetical protein [Sphaerisporangium krabiense]